MLATEKYLAFFINEKGAILKTENFLQIHQHVVVNLLKYFAESITSKPQLPKIIISQRIGISFTIKSNRMRISTRESNDIFTVL